MENKKNSGVTLIELIVIIAIMAVLTGGFATTMALIGRQKVSNAASSTKSSLQLAQSYAKSKDNCVFSIIGSSNGGSNEYIYTYEDKDVGDPSKWKLGNGPKNINEKITTVVYFENGDSVTLSDGVRVDIRFVRSTGGFAKIQVPGKPSGTESTPTKITFSNKTKSVSLLLAKYTGVVTYDN